MFDFCQILEKEGVKRKVTSDIYRYREGL